MAFIDQEASEKVEEIDAKVCCAVKNIGYSGVNLLRLISFVSHCYVQYSLVALLTALFMNFKAHQLSINACRFCTGYIKY